MRHNPKKDRNHNDIKEYLESCGCKVWDAAGGHGGIPDLIVSYDLITVMVEVKDGDRPPSERRLTPSQEKYFNHMAGANFVCTSMDDATAIMISIQLSNNMLKDRGFYWPNLNDKL